MSEFVGEGIDQADRVAACGIEESIRRVDHHIPMAWRVGECKNAEIAIDIAGGETDVASHPEHPFGGVTKTGDRCAVVVGFVDEVQTTLRTNVIEGLLEQREPGLVLETAGSCAVDAGEPCP